MTYQVLARKYRSQTFDEVVGQDPIAQTLKNAIKTGRVAHAYLFAGTRGIGKTTMARILAKALNCLSTDAPTTKPCCNCDACLAINLGDDIDVIEIDGASNRGIDNIRELRQNAIYRPARSRFKIYIIDEVHMLTTEAFNALLKTLEEPPAHIKFIFATTEPNKVLATIQSRCQRFDFSNINPKLIAGQLKQILKKEKIEYEDDLILPLAKMANGSMRDGLSLLDRLISIGSQPLTTNLLQDFLGCPDSEKISKIIEQIGKSSAAGTLEAADSLISSGLSEVQIVDSLIDYMRDLMVVKSAGSDSDLLILTAQQRQNAALLAENFDIAALVYNITALEKLRWTIKNADSPRPLLEAALLRFALSEHFLNVDQLLSQPAEIQNKSVKKNAVNNTKADVTHPAASQKPQAKQQTASLDTIDLNSLKNNWPALLKLLAQKIGNGTSTLLTRAVPTRFENNTLTITFDASAKVQKKMCESNSRPDQIRSIFSDYFKKDIQLTLELGTADLSAASQAASQAADQARTARQKENQIVNNPAVKTILTELGATITNIEGLNNNS